MKTNQKRKTALALLIVALLLSACTQTNPTSQNSKTSGKQVSVTTASAETKPTKTSYLLGETISTESLNITVMGTRFSNGEEFMTPADGNVFYYADVIIENKGKKSDSISSMLMFSMQDVDARKYTPTISTENIGSIDGVLPAGKYIRGEMCFEIPKDDTSLILQINPSVFGMDQIFTIDLSTASQQTYQPEAMDQTKNSLIGTPIDLGGVSYTVNSVRNSDGNEFLGADEGKTYFLIDISIENKSTESAAISSAMMFSLIDGNGYKINQSIAADTNGTIDGELAVGGKIRGEIAYEVPINSEHLELWICDIFSSENAAVTVK